LHIHFADAARRRPLARYISNRTVGKEITDLLPEPKKAQTDPLFLATV
jgi:hypothetical protein